MPDRRLAPATTALAMAARQRDISVSEFFLKNRHLLGFDTPAKALVTAVREAVDNALDACEEAHIVPEIGVQVTDRYSGKYGQWSKTTAPASWKTRSPASSANCSTAPNFTSSASRAASRAWAFQPPACMPSSWSASRAHHQPRQGRKTRIGNLRLDRRGPKPARHPRKKRITWERPHGTRVEMEIEGHYQKGPHSIETYLKQTAIANPHVTLVYRDPQGVELRFERTVRKLPPRPQEIKLHPYGIELGRLIQMLSDTRKHTLLQFLTSEFSRVGRKTALAMIKQAGRRLSERSYPKHIARVQATAPHRAIQKTHVQAPRTDCIVPVGEKNMLKGLRKELDADFFTVTTRPAAAYRGNPFQIEVGIAYGHKADAAIDLDAHGRMRKQAPEAAGEALVAWKNEPARLLRFANRVPLLYQQASCAITKAVTQNKWRGYGLQQSKGVLPIAPMAIVIHVASVWLPYTSESKEAIEPYPEILKEIKLGLQQCGRELGQYLRRTACLQEEYGRRGYIEKFLPHIGIALQEMLTLSDRERDAAMQRLDDTLHASRTKGHTP